MSENKRYYWLKLSEDFFKDDTTQWILEQENGSKYLVFYLKLAIRSLIDDGYLIRYVGEKMVSHTVESLALMTNTDRDTVKVAMEMFLNIGLISQLDTGELKMNQIEEMAGSETDSAKRMRKLRAKENKLKALEGTKRHNVTNERHNVQKCDTEYRDKSIEIRDKSIDINIAQGKSKSKKENELEFERLWELYPNKKGKKTAKRAYLKAVKDNISPREIEEGILAYKKEIQLKGTPNQYIAHGSTWFNQRRWEDEYNYKGKVISEAFVEDAPTNPDEVQYSDEDRYWYEKLKKEQAYAENE